MPVTSTARLLTTTVFAALAFAASLAGADAQTTLVLNAPGTQVTDATIQGGLSATINASTADMIATRASTNPDYLRRALLAFDTATTLPSDATLRSATLTLTVKTAGTDAARTIGVFPVTTAFVAAETTWTLRQAGTAWTTAGGDLSAEAARQSVSNVAGAKASFDATGLVQAALRGVNGSRSTRLALADLGASTNASYHEFYSSKAVDPAVRPVLTIVYDVPAPPCAATLDKTSLAVGAGEANWTITVTTACAWSATSDAAWLVVKSTAPVPAVGNGSIKMRAVANTTSVAKRIGHVTVNSAVYTVTQSGCGTSCTVVDPPVPPVVTPPPTGSTLRLLQYNTHHGGYGTDNVFSTERIANWVVASHADVVSLQEIEINTSWSKGLDDTVIYQTLLQQKTGQTWYKVFFSLSGASTGIGDLILSRYPFIATGHQLLSGGRSAVNATIDVNGRTVNVTSAHLDSVSQANRIQAVAELLAWQATLAENRIVVGDYNAWPGTTEIANMSTDYLDTWVAATAAGTAIAWSGNPTGITHAYHRIDYIFQSKNAPALQLQSVTVFDTSDQSANACVTGCFANSTGIDPSDHRPVMAIFNVQ